MRLYIIALILLISATSYAETPDQQIARLQASIDSLRNVEYAAGCTRAALWVTAQVGKDTTGAELLSSFGVQILKDVSDVACPNTDSMYVRVDYPLVSSTGMKKAFVAGIYQETINNVGAIPTSTAGRLKMRKDSAVAVLQNLIALLKIQ